MAVKTFNLPVNKDEHIRVVYQRPDDAAPLPEDSRPHNRPISEKKWEKIINEFIETPAQKSEKPLIIMMHGFPGGHKSSCDDLYVEMEQRLTRMAYPSLRFDFRGCGESDGREEDFCLDHASADLNAVMQWAQHDAGHRSFILMGEAVGATVAAIGYKPGVVKALILLWPALILNQTKFKALFTREKMLEGDKSTNGDVMFEGHKLGKPFINEIYQYDLTSTLEKIKAPTLIQHDTADAEIPLDQAYFGRDHIPGLEDMAIFEGGNHGLRALNMRHHVFLNIEYFLVRLAKKLDLDAKN